MIYALSLNPCVDKTLSIPYMDLDNPNRVTLERTDVGGKGVNVARVIHALGGDGTLMGFDYDGSPVSSAMEKEGVPCLLQHVPGSLRVNLKIRETETGRTVEINEKGPFHDAALLKKMQETLLAQCDETTFVSLSGSLPNGAPKTLYAALVKALKKKGCFVAVDCDGEVLQAALEEGPSLIKPNLPEFLALTGTSDPSLPSLRKECLRLHERGVGMICLSLGPDGALLSTGKEACFCPAADVPVLGTQGAGDSMLGALLLSLHRGDSLPKALCFASAAAGASIQRPGTLLCTKDTTLALLPALSANPL